MSDIIEDASPWQHCESLDSIQNSDTAFSWVCTTAGKHNVREQHSQRRREICNIPGHKKHFFFSFSPFLTLSLRSSLRHTNTASDDASNHFANLPLECMLVGHWQREREREKGPKDKERQDTGRIH